MCQAFKNACLVIKHVKMHKHIIKKLKILISWVEVGQIYKKLGLIYTDVEYAFKSIKINFRWQIPPPPLSNIWQLIIP